MLVANLIVSNLPTAAQFKSCKKKKPYEVQPYFSALNRNHLRLDQELHQASVPTGGSSMQRCPQLTVAGVDGGAGVQQALHHLHEVVDATLRKHSAESQLWRHSISLGNYDTRDICMAAHPTFM